MIYKLRASFKSAIHASLAIIASSALIPASFAASQSGNTSEGQSTSEEFNILPEVTIAAHSFGIPVQNTGVSVTKLDTKILQEQGIYSVDEAIKQSPGVYVMSDCGQRGAASPIRIRGLNQGAYTLTVVDGIRISDSNVPCSAFFGTQNVLGMNTIEVVRGPQGAVYGSQAIGGIISFGMPTGSGKPSYTLFAEGGSFGSAIVATSAQGEIDKVAYSVIAEYETTQNDPQHPESYANQPGYMDYSQYFESAKFVISMTEATKLSLSFRNSDNKYERPGYGATEISRLKDDYKFTLVSFHLESEVSKKYTTELLGGYYHYQFEESGSIDFGYGPSSNDATTNYDKYQLEWKNLFTWNEEWKTSLGTAMDWVDYETTAAWNANGYHDDETVFALYAEQLYQPIKSLDFSIAGRWENYDKWGDQFSWRFGSSWKVTGEGSPTRLFGTIGSGFRAPALTELNGWGNNPGNPNLQSTDAMGYDFGIEQKIIENHQFTVTGFWTHIADIIQTSYGSAPINAGNADSYGVETAFTGSFKDAWNSGYRIAYTYTHASDENGKQIPCIAKHVINGELFTSPIEKLTIGLGIDSAMGRTNFAGADQYHLDNFCTLRFFTRYKVSENITLHARVENLTNDKYMLADERFWGSGAPIMARRIGFFGGATIEF